MRSPHTFQLCSWYFKSLINVVFSLWEFLEFTACPMVIDEFLLSFYYEIHGKMPFFVIVWSLHKFEGSNSHSPLENCWYLTRSLFHYVKSIVVLSNHDLRGLLLFLSRCRFSHISLHVLWVFCSQNTGQWWLGNLITIQHRFHDEFGINLLYILFAFVFEAQSRCGGKVAVIGLIYWFFSQNWLPKWQIVLTSSCLIH